MSEQTIEKSSTGSSAASTHGVPISLKKLTKRYPGTDKAAVDAVDMEIPAGEIVWNAETASQGTLNSIIAKPLAVPCASTGRCT